MKSIYHIADFRTQFLWMIAFHFLTCFVWLQCDNSYWRGTVDVQMSKRGCHHSHVHLEGSPGEPSPFQCWAVHNPPRSPQHDCWYNCNCNERLFLWYSLGKNIEKWRLRQCCIFEFSSYTKNQVCLFIHSSLRNLIAFFAQFWQLFWTPLSTFPNETDVLFINEPQNIPFAGTWVMPNATISLKCKKCLCSVPLLIWIIR